MMLFPKFTIALCLVGSLPSRVVAVDASELYSINPGLSELSNGGDFVYAYVDPKTNKVVQGETKGMSEKIRRGGMIKEPCTSHSTQSLRMA
jgi:hypothetical protein